MESCKLYVPVVIKTFMDFNCNHDEYQVYPIPPRSTQPVMFDSVNTNICEDLIFDSFDMDEECGNSDEFDGFLF